MIFAHSNEQIQARKIHIDFLWPEHPRLGDSSACAKSLSLDCKIVLPILGGPLADSEGASECTLWLEDLNQSIEISLQSSPNSVNYGRRLEGAPKHTEDLEDKATTMVHKATSR